MFVSGGFSHPFSVLGSSADLLCLADGNGCC